MVSAISYNIFKRPDVSRIVLNRIREAAPSKLYLFSDGPRDKIEKSLVEKNRIQILKLIDWDCNVVTHFLDENIGFEKMWDFTFQQVFKDEDRIIILEEDILPDLSFFRFCDELLEYYKDDNSVYRIGGFNALTEYPSNTSQSYFFGEVVSSWGMATWKRVYELNAKDPKILKDPYYSKILKKRFEYSAGGYYWYNHLKLISERPDLKVDSAEFWFLGLNENILFNSLAIIPKYNLITNLGNSEGAENSDSSEVLTLRQKRHFQIGALKMPFPLEHPKFKVIDYEFYFKVKKNNNPPFFIILMEKIERGYRILRYKGPHEFNRKFKIYLVRMIHKLRFNSKI